MASKARQLAQSASAPDGRKNVVINGAMQVAQRGTSVTGIGASAGYFTVDRFNLNRHGIDGRVTMTQTADGPSGFASCIKLDCTTADTSIGADDFFLIEQRFEGADLQRFMKGTSDAKEYAVSFYVKGNASATYVVELFDIDNTRQVSKSFSVTTSWTRVELIFPADTTGAFDNDANLSLNMHIFLHAGANLTSGTLSQTWTSNTGANRAVGISSFFDSTYRTFFITGVQLEVGSVVTEFEHQKYCDVYKDCQRYYYKSGDNANEWFPGSTTNAEKGPYYALAADGLQDRAYPALQWPVQMRAAPSVTFYPGRTDVANTADRITQYNGATLTTYTTSPTAYSNGLSYHFAGTSLDAPFYTYHIVADAEL